MWSQFIWKYPRVQWCKMEEWNRKGGKVNTRVHYCVVPALWVSHVGSSETLLGTWRNAFQNCFLVGDARRERFLIDFCGQGSSHWVWLPYTSRVRMHEFQVTWKIGEPQRNLWAGSKRYAAFSVPLQKVSSMRAGMASLTDSLVSVSQVPEVVTGI